LAAPAKQFLDDLCADARQATVASRLISFPSFPGAFRQADLAKVAAADPNEPKKKYSILATVAQGLRSAASAHRPGFGRAHR
jgi:hypothetical protein